MALSAISAASIFVWRKQDRREAHEAREQEIISAVNATWVATELEGAPDKKWGILVTNTLNTPIHNFSVSCAGNTKTATLVQLTVQPGAHFFESLPNSSTKAWGFAVSSLQTVDYIMESSKHSTQELSFTLHGREYTKQLRHPLRQSQSSA